MPALVVLALLLPFAGLACTTPDVPVAGTDPYHLQVVLAHDGFDLSWAPDLPSSVYDVQRSSSTRAWTALPPAPRAPARLTDVVEQRTYSFRIRAVSPAGVWSPSVTRTFVVPRLPVVRIDTEHQAPILDKDNYVRASMTIDPNGSAVAAYSGTLGIRGRGNTTWGLPKKPYRLKLDSSSAVMGMPASKDWALLANYLDKSQLRTYLAGEFGRDTSLAWTPGYRWVEVVLNGSYDGVYQLVEHVKIAPDRIPIDKMSSTDNSGDALTGGYQLEVDERLEENHEVGFRTTRNEPVVVKDPDPATTEQFDYIRSYVQDFENLLYSSGFTDPVTGYRSHLDASSYVDWYLVEELSRNQDAFFSSTDLYKPRLGKLTFGPLWDFDLSMGSTAGIRPIPTDGWWVNRPDAPAWPRRLSQDPTLVQQTVARWDQLRPAFEAVIATIPQLGTVLAPAIANDAARWQYTVGPSDTPGYLVDWLQARVAWMDSAFHAPSP